MTPFRLDAKTALVTGAGSGIGRAIAELFAAQGALVWVVDHDETGAETAVRAIRERGGRAEAARADVAAESEMAALGERTGPVDVLVNNAGTGHVGNLLGTAAADLDRLYAVNVRGVFNGTKTWAPAMLERGRGSVITMASVAGLVAVRERLAYTTTKFAVVGLTKALALDHSGTGVRFNCICPGRVETPFVMQRIAAYPDPERAYREMAATQLTGRMVRPDEVAAAALYLASDASEMVTGSCLSIDGGWTAGK
ncbi:MULTISPECIES: SDR family NAD(P)-dependent oxidoreductase [Sorangium]|uniref:Glucose 1-dehydrogenase n=1 Tax=Sorangium atrum TaxID=2995308 RepID=A0ABT5CDQ8_9BACT|nr:glucose 1-dehydrogenase [Sorangium aterium]MDC0684078.1 glucose 1-dehydrogenase [Sorangium aterium]